MFETDIGTDNEPEHSGSFMYWSIPYYWLKEWRLSNASKSWVRTSAVVESTFRTKGGYRETIRAVIRYSYRFNGEHYDGEMRRECVFDTTAADALAYDHPAGEQITILVNPSNPDQSYFASGFGAIEPFLTGILALFCTVLLLCIVVGLGIAGLKGELR